MKGALPRKPSEILTPDRMAILLRALTPDRMALDGHVDWWQAVIVCNLQTVRDALFHIRPLLQWSLCECCRRCRVASRLIRKCRNRSWTGNSWPPALLSQRQIKSRPTRPPVPPTCGHFIHEKDGHAKQCNHFLVPFRKIKFRFVVGAQIKEAMQSGRSNLNARKGHIQRNEKQWWGSSLCVFYLDICSRNASRCSGLALHAVYDRPKEDGREQEAFT